MLRVILLWTLTTMVASNPRGIDFTEMNNTAGIIFVPFTKAQLSYKEWKLVYYYDLNKYYEEITIIEHFYYRLNQICNEALATEQETFANNCHLAVSHAGYHMNQIMDNKNIINSFNSHKNRKRRSPFNIIGNVAGSLFGVLDQEDAERYNSEINKIKSDQNYQNELMKKQTLITERLTKATNNSLNDVISKLNNMDKSMSNMIINKKWTEITQNFNTMAATLALILIDHDQITTEIRGILSHTLKGEIIDLIPIEQLEDNLIFINNHVGKNEELAIDFMRDGVYGIFKTASIHSILRNNLVLIEISLPILELEEFEIYRAIPIPTKVNDKYVTILPSSDLFITNTEKTQYIPLSEQELKNCIKRNTGKFICKQNEPIHNGEENTCELMLLAKPYMQSLPKNCEIRTVPTKNYIIYLHESNKFFCVINTPIQFQTICPNETDVFKIENTGILKIHNHCYIKNENFIIKSHSTNQYEKNEVIKPKFILSDIINPKTRTMSNSVKEESEIFIRNHFSDFHEISDDISKLIEDEENKQLLYHYDGKIRTLNFSTGGIITILASIVILIFTLKIRKILKTQKENKNKINTDIEMQANTQPNETYAEIQRAPTPFVRRTISKNET